MSRNVHCTCENVGLNLGTLLLPKSSQKEQRHLFTLNVLEYKENLLLTHRIIHICVFFFRRFLNFSSLFYRGSICSHIDSRLGYCTFLRFLPWICMEFCILYFASRLKFKGKMNIVNIFMNLMFTFEPM